MASLSNGDPQDDKILTHSRAARMTGGTLDRPDVGGAGRSDRFALGVTPATARCRSVIGLAYDQPIDREP